jgi:hypothetical protein
METPIGAKVAAAFVKAQRQFGPALKTATNPHFRSRYADLSACVEAVLDALNANGIGLMQRTYECANGVMIETVLIHESGEVIEGGMLNVPASKQDPQGYGSALTYARRYSLMACVGIAPEDDDGNAASRKSTVDANVMADHLAAIDASSTSEEMQKAYAAAFNAAQGDAAWQEKVIAAKKARVERAKKEKKE